MSVEKFKLKCLVYQDIGKKFEILEEETKKDIYRLEGSTGALKTATEALFKHKNFYQTELNNQTITSSDYELFNKCLEHCIGILNNLNETTKIQKNIKQGEIIAYSKTLDICENLFKTEETKANILENSIKNGLTIDDRFPEKNSRVIGQNPGDNFTVKRKKTKEGNKK